MTTKLYNLTDWALWREGKSLPLPKDKARTVRIEFIAAAAAMIRVRTEEQAIAAEAGQLIGVMPFGGHEIFEFGANGNVLVDVTSDAEVMFYCSENDQYWFEFADEVSFTKPYERPLVDPVYQAMRLQMMKNMQAMEQRLMLAAERRREPEPPQARPVGERSVDGTSQPPASGDPSPAEGQAPAAGPQVKPKAPASGSGVQPPASGEGG